MKVPPSAARKRVKSRHSSKCRCTITNTLTYDPSDDCTTPLNHPQPLNPTQCRPAEAMHP
jgi:hypothetical protein